MGALKELKVAVRVGENFSPNSLMVRYAALHAGVEFEHLPYFETALKIGGDTYKYDHWKIEPGDEGQEIVTLYMRKMEKELFRWSIQCSWPEAEITENVSVLAEGLRAALDKAKEAFSESYGAPIDEIEVGRNVIRQKADLGLELYKAVKYEGYSNAAALIRRGADVNYRFEPDEFNYTPLHMAAYNADLLKMELLVEAGCEMNPLSADGATPLDMAIARHNYPNIVEYLEEYGAMRGLDVVLEHAHERTRELVGKVVASQELGKRKEELGIV